MVRVRNLRAAIVRERRVTPVRDGSFRLGADDAMRRIEGCAVFTGETPVPRGMKGGLNGTV